MEKNRYVFLFFELLVTGIFVIGLVSADLESWISDTALPSIGAGEGWQYIVLVLIVVVIVFAVLYDLTMFFPFISSPWVRYVVAGGLTVASVLFGGIRAVSVALLTIASGIGAIGVFLMIIVSLIIAIVIFTGFGGFVRRLAERVRANNERTRAMRVADEAAAGINEAMEFRRQTG